MQVNRQAWLLEGPRHDPAASANVRFHRKPVREAVCLMVVSSGHNNLSWMEKSLDQCSLCDSTANVTTDGALLGLAANHRVAANNFPHSPATLPSIQSHQSCCDQHSFVSHSAPFESSTAGSKQCDSQGGQDQKTRTRQSPTMPT